MFSAPAFGNWPGLGPSPGGVGHWSPMPPTGPDSHGDPSCGAALHHWGPVGGGVKPQWVTPALHGISLPTQTQLEGVWTPTLCKAGLLMGSQTHLYPRCGIAIGGGGHRVPAAGPHRRLTYVSRDQAEAAWVSCPPFIPRRLCFPKFLINIHHKKCILHLDAGSHVYRRNRPTRVMHRVVSHTALDILPFVFLSACRVQPVNSACMAHKWVWAISSGN